MTVCQAQRVGMQRQKRHQRGAGTLINFCFIRQGAPLNDATASTYGPLNAQLKIKQMPENKA